MVIHLFSVIFLKLKKEYHEIYIICPIVAGPSHGSALTWHMRMKIALDAAR